MVGFARSCWALFSPRAPPLALATRPRQIRRTRTSSSGAPISPRLETARCATPRRMERLTPAARAQFALWPPYPATSPPTPRKASGPGPTISSIMRSTTGWGATGNSVPRVPLSVVHEGDARRCAGDPRVPAHRPAVERPFTSEPADVSVRRPGWSFGVERPLFRPGEFRPEPGKPDARGDETLRHARGDARDRCAGEKCRVKRVASGPPQWAHAGLLPRGGEVRLRAFRSLTVGATSISSANSSTAK